MTTLQKAIKYLAVAFAIFLVVSILGGALGAVGFLGGIFSNDAILAEAKVYRVENPVHSLKVSINAADFSIKEAEAFSVESNLKYLSVSESNGVLTIADEKTLTGTYSGATLTLFIPSGVTFNSVSITTGAAKLTADTLSAKAVKLELGAGDVNFHSLNAADKAEIEGGAGRITIAGGALNDLSLEMGVGELNLTAALLGSSDLDFGVGQSNLTLLGSKDDYHVDIKKAIGSITVDGKPAADFAGSETGDNRVDIEGGIGAIHLNFRDTAA